MLSYSSPFRQVKDRQISAGCAAGASKGVLEVHDEHGRRLSSRRSVRHTGWRRRGRSSAEERVVETNQSVNGGSVHSKNSAQGLRSNMGSLQAVEKACPARPQRVKRRNRTRAIR